MSKEQEDLFNEFTHLHECRYIMNIAAFVQNDIDAALEEEYIDIGILKNIREEQQTAFEDFITKLQQLKMKCASYFDTYLPKTYSGKDIEKIVMVYWFQKTYNFSFEPYVYEEFVEANDFYVMVTAVTAKNGYDDDKRKVLTTLKLNVPYKLQAMSVSQSSSTITLVDFPDVFFNSANFEFLPTYEPKIST